MSGTLSCGDTQTPADTTAADSGSAATIIASNESAAQQKLNDLTAFFAE